MTTGQNTAAKAEVAETTDNGRTSAKMPTKQIPADMLSEVVDSGPG